MGRQLGVSHDEYAQIFIKYGLNPKALRTAGGLERFMQMSEDARLIFASLHRATKEARA